MNTQACSFCFQVSRPSLFFLYANSGRILDLPLPFLRMRVKSLSDINILFCCSSFHTDTHTFHTDTHTFLFFLLLNIHVAHTYSEYFKIMLWCCIFLNRYGSFCISVLLFCTKCTGNLNVGECVSKNNDLAS